MFLLLANTWFCTAYSWRRRILNWIDFEQKSIFSRIIFLSLWFRLLSRFLWFFAENCRVATKQKRQRQKFDNMENVGLFCSVYTGKITVHHSIRRDYLQYIYLTLFIFEANSLLLRWIFYVKLQVCIQGKCDEVLYIWFW